jgi:hypothetical protein
MCARSEVTDVYLRAAWTWPGFGQIPLTRRRREPDDLPKRYADDEVEIWGWRWE